MNRERLEHTAREVLPYVKDEDFRMAVWACQTAACAFGSEALSKYGRKNGLCVMRSASPHERGEVWLGDLNGLAAVESYYGIDKTTAFWIVDPNAYDELGWDSDQITPAMVAERIESLLACGE